MATLTTWVMWSHDAGDAGRRAAGASRPSRPSGRRRHPTGPAGTHRRSAVEPLDRQQLVRAPHAAPVAQRALGGMREVEPEVARSSASRTRASPVASWCCVRHLRATIRGHQSSLVRGPNWPSAPDAREDRLDPPRRLRQQAGVAGEVRQGHEPVEVVRTPLPVLAGAAQPGRIGSRRPPRCSSSAPVRPVAWRRQLLGQPAGRPDRAQRQLHQCRGPQPVRARLRS